MALDKERDDFNYIKEKFNKISDAKIKKKILLTTYWRQIWSYFELTAWSFFKAIIKEFTYVTEKQINVQHCCRSSWMTTESYPMSLKIHLQSHLESSSPENWVMSAIIETVIDSVKTFLLWSSAIREKVKWYRKMYLPIYYFFFKIKLVWIFIFLCNNINNYKMVLQLI